MEGASAAARCAGVVSFPGSRQASPYVSAQKNQPIRRSAKSANGTQARVALRLRSLYAFRMPTMTPPYWLMGSLAGSSMATKVPDARDVLRLAAEWAGMGVRDIKIEDAA